MPASYFSPKLEVRAAPKKGGFAVYAREALAKDELLCVWTGRALTREEMVLLSDAEKSHTIQVDEEIYLAPLSSEEDPADYINHSCDPNAGICGQISLVAMRPIAPGEEITFDYAMSDSSAFDEFICACGSPLCRGRVTGDDWKRQDLWVRYDGYFSTYLQRRINALRTPKLLIATGNQGKLQEMAALLEGLPVQLVTPQQIGLDLAVKEDGSTYQENAAKKARAYSQASGLVALADDSGLEVDALGGEPGLYSARYSGKPGASDADRRAFLLEKLKDKPRPWTAHFHATVAVGTPDGLVQFAEANCYGEIIPEERGTGGFGYDPIFFIPEMNCTMAELSLEQKNRLSHRALAVKLALPLLQKIIRR